MSESKCLDTFTLKQQCLTSTPYVVLDRLTKEEIQRACGKSYIEQPSTSMSNVSYLPINVKQEPQYSADTVITEQSSIISTTVESTWQQKIQEIDIKVETKTERQEESLTNNPTFSNYNENNNLIQFNCKLCYEIFNNEEEYLVHTFLLHKDNRPHKCKICLKEFSIGAHLNLHLAQHVNDVYLKGSSLIQATEIQSSSTNSLTMNSIKNNDYQLSLILTKNSQNDFSTMNVQKTQNLTVKSSQNYFKTNSRLFSTNNRRLKSFKCTDCTFASVSEDQFLDHFTNCNSIINRPRTSNMSHHCELCLKSFHNRTALNGHMKYHSFRGEIISKKYKKKINSKSRIIRTQKNIDMKMSCNQTNALKCKYCNKCFASSHRLHIHNLQHKKQMVCKVCNKQFFFKKSFDKHLLLHQPFSKTPKIRIKDHKNKAKIQTIKPFQCASCKNCFTTKRALLSHTKTHHCDVPIPIYRKSKSRNSYSTCNWCGKAITTGNLIRHIRSFHPKVRPLKCQLCSMKFKNVASKKLHLNKYHRK